MGIIFLFQRHFSGQSVFRIMATIFASMLAALALLTTVSLGQGWATRSQKNDLLQVLLPSESAIKNTTSAKKLVYLSTHESEFDTQSIKEIGIYKTDPSESLPAGLTTIPMENEMWVTPALKHLIDTNPLLQERYSHYKIQATFPSELAPSPDSLMALYRLKSTVLTNAQASLQVTSADQLWNTYTHQKTRNDRDSGLLQTALLLAGVILITPILLLITEVSRIGIAQREKRYAVMSLIGATNAQMRLLVLADALPFVIIGMALGLIIFHFIITSVLATVVVASESLWVSDLLLPMGTYIAIMTSVIVCAAGASLQSIRRVVVSPLEVSRTNNDIKKPSFLLVLPLLVGTGALCFLSVFAKQWYKENAELGSMLVTGLLLVIILGIFVAGPYVVRLFSGLMVRLSQSAPSVIAAYRMQSTARKTFRSLSGIVIALFVGTLLMTLLATVQASYSKQSMATQKVADPHLDPLYVPWQLSVAIPNITEDKMMTNRLIQDIAADGAIAKRVTKGYVQKAYQDENQDDDTERKQGDYYQSCKEFTQRLGYACPKDTDPTRPFVVSLQFALKPDGTSTLKPNFTTVQPVKGAIYDRAYVVTAKDSEAFSYVVNKVNNLVSNYYFTTGNTATIDYQKPIVDTSQVMIQSVSGLIFIPLIITMLVGGLSVFVSIVGSVFERKKMFIRLRIIGSTVTVFVRALFIEILLPLLVLALLIIGLGIACCYWVLTSIGAVDMGDISFALPGSYFWVGIGVVVVLCSLLSLLTIPLLSRLTNLDEMRSE